MAKHRVVFAEHFLSDGDISMDIGVTAPPIITANYIESYHKVCDVLSYSTFPAIFAHSFHSPSHAFTLSLVVTYL